MKTVTVKEILSRENIGLGGGCNLYAIRDNDVVFYVGQTSDFMANRLRRHLKDASTIAQAIADNLPDSLNWQVDLIDVAPDEMDREERLLITKHNPCFNVTYNPNPSQLPERYIDPRLPDLEVTVSDFIPF